MAEPIETQLILLNNGSSLLSSEMHLPLPTRWTPRPGHYLDMIIRRVDFVNYFRYNITQYNNRLLFNVIYPLYNGRDEFAWTLSVDLYFPDSRVSEQDFVTLFNAEIDKIYEYLEDPSEDVFSKFAPKVPFLIPLSAHPNTRVFFSAPKLEFYNLKVISGEFIRPHIAFAVGAQSYILSPEVPTANALRVTVELDGIPPSYYLSSVLFSLEGPLAEEIGLVDTDEGQGEFCELLLSKPANDFSTTVWESQGLTPDTEEFLINGAGDPLYPASALPSFPHTVLIGPKLLMIESMTVTPSKYAMLGFREDIPRCSPIYSVPFPPLDLTGNVQLYTSPPVPSFRIPGALEAFHFRFFIDGRPLETKFEITMEIMVREMAEHDSLAAPTFQHDVHGVVGPPVLSFHDTQRAERHKFTHPDEYDARVTHAKRHR